MCTKTADFAIQDLEKYGKALDKLVGFDNLWNSLLRLDMQCDHEVSRAQDDGDQ